MRSALLIAVAWTSGCLVAWGAYIERQPVTTVQPDEETLPQGVQPAVPGTPEFAYPYYGNIPSEMIPFREIEPHARYWTSRLPFRGPGRDYPDTPGLKSLRIGLLSPVSC